MALLHVDLGITGSERVPRLRCLAAFTMLYWRSGKRVIDLLRQAEHAPELTEVAMAEFHKIPTLARRNIIASFQRLHAPTLTAVVNHDS